MTEELVEQPIVEQPVDLTHKRLFEFQAILPRLNRLVTKSDNKVRTKVEENRRLRFFAVDSEELRERKEIEEDETIVNIRTINTNIEREQPAFMGFLRNSRRIVTFSRKEGYEKIRTEQIEDEFTRGITYPGWEIPHYQRLDGCELHGWDALEVVLDLSKPFHVALDHIGHANLIFPEDSIDIQAHEVILRKYEVTASQLRDMVTDFDFNAQEVDKLISTRQDAATEDDLLCIYKVFFKYQKQVYSGWVELKLTNDWLKAPALHYIGWDEKTQLATWERKPLTFYPIFVLRYKLTEEKTIQSTNGRAVLDKPKQEALTALWSGFINGATRASNPSASPKNPSGNGRSPSQLETGVPSGTAWSEPMDFWAPPYPDESMIRAAQHLDTQNSQEVGQLTFAVQNRRGSRTTAKEITAAEQQNALLNSVQLTLFSTDIREIYTLVWKIVQSRALQNLFPFLAVVPQETISPIDGQVQQTLVNDLEMIGKEYEIRAAGDVDVIQRAEHLATFKEFWPIVGNTSIAPVFLQDMLRLAFPAYGEKYVAMLDNHQASKEVIGKLLQLVAGFVQANPQVMEGLPPEAKQSMMGLMQEAQLEMAKV
jgi:hypothetical protein